MKALRLALAANYNNLAKLRARLLYCHRTLLDVNDDYHKLYGAYAGYWDEWVIQLESIKTDLHEQVVDIDNFLSGVYDFALTINQKEKLSVDDKSYLREVTEITTEKITEQKELLSSFDIRLKIHQQLTKRLLLVEAIEDLGDEA